MRRRTVLVGGAALLAGPGAVMSEASAAGAALTGLQTRDRIDDPMPCFVVTAIRWDSPFRAAGLRIGDRIVALDSTPVAAPAEMPARQAYVQRFPGQYDEGVGSARRPGDRVRLTVRRRRIGQGWDRVEIAAPTYTPPADRTGNDPSLFPGGPSYLTDDGTGNSWSDWWDHRLQPMIQEALTQGWDEPSWNNRFASSQLEEQRPRVELLQRLYPGSYSAGLAADFEAAVACAAGARIELTEPELRWRRAEEDKRNEAAARATAGWAAWLEAATAERIEPFPAADPFGPELRSQAGKLVLLPDLRPQDWIQGADRTWFVAGNQRDGWYAADASQPAVLAMLLALERWRRLVSTSIDERYVMAGRLLPRPTLVVVGERSWPMLQLEPVAAIVGDAMFVDLASREGTRAEFAGEAALALPHTATPPDDAAPEEVLAASTVALKHGDLAAWNALFADFEYDVLPNGAVMVTPWTDPRAEDRWEDARRLIMDRIFDVRVAWVDDVTVVTDGTAFPGQARIEAVEAIVDHVGRFDGPDGPEYRVFMGVVTNRRRQLLRMNGGPWRIASGPEV